jgi:hypothetical protein
MFSSFMYRRFIILFFGLIVFALLVHFVGWREKGLFERYGTDDLYRFGSWYTLNQKPYTDVDSPYPQLATYFFALPHSIAHAISSSYDKTDYKLVFSLLMMVLLVGTIVILFSMRSTSKNYAFLMLLPASLFFAHQRYDIIPALLGVISVSFLLKDRYRTAAIFLALGVMAKWYLIVIFPILFRYAYLKKNRIDFGMIGTFVVTGSLFVLLTILHSGFDALFVPYRFHLGRGYNLESLFYHLYLLFNSILTIDIAMRYGYLIFFLLQFCVVPFVLRADIRTPRDVYAWSAISILCFMLFSKFYSPQWIIWAMPFLILWISNKKEACAVIAFDVATYLYFPIAYRNLDLSSYWFAISIGIKNISLVLLIALLVKTILMSSRDAHAAQQPARDLATE